MGVLQARPVRAEAELHLPQPAAERSQPVDQGDTEGKEGNYSLSSERYLKKHIIMYECEFINEFF